MFRVRCGLTMRSMNGDTSSRCAAVGVKERDKVFIGGVEIKLS